ncbi:MAG TPA: aryl-sulfate sulfotransferase [Verrucomicrobiae bacterium]|nr:aryl-sulfate sulfotransferase [Verrucomicrobiae bacterium]
MKMLFVSSRRFFIFVATIFVLTAGPYLQAVTIVSDPTFTPAANAPLAGVLQLATDVDSRVSVLVSDGTSVWEKDFYDFGTVHSETLLGFKPGRTNLILVTVFDESRNACTATQLLQFVTAPLPANFPAYSVLTDEPDEMEPGYTLFVINNRSKGSAYITIMDNSGQVVWYRPVLQSSDIDVRQLGDGNLFIHEQPPANQFVEMNLLGETVRTWTPPAGYPLNSHEGFITDHGTILYLSDVSEVVTNFPSVLPKYPPTNTNPSPTTVKVDDNPVVEISATNGALLHVWSPLNQMDPTRVTYITADFPSPISGTLDTEHANAIVDDTNDDSIIVSLRDQNTIYKFSRATGKLTWILAPHANWPTNFQPYLLTPVGTPFEWSYGQHAPELTPQGTLLVFDDGEYRAEPYDPPIAVTNDYSRAVEYSIDETNMTISQVWDSYDSGQGGGDRLLSSILGRVQWLPQRRNVLVTYGWINYVNGGLLNPSPATMSRIVEYTHDPVPRVVFDLSFWFYDIIPSGYGYSCYRSYRIPDLYSHSAGPVTDLSIYPPGAVAAQVAGGQFAPMHLEFSADPTFTYEIQASTDLENWINVGTATQNGGPGDFGFDDLSASQFATRYYRVVTY